MLLLAEQEVLWSESEEGSQSPYIEDLLGNTAYPLNYWRFGDGDRQTYLLNQILSDMNMKLSTRRDNKCLLMSPFFQVAEKISKKVMKRFCGVTTIALPAWSTLSQGGAIENGGRSHYWKALVFLSHHLT